MAGVHGPPAMCLLGLSVFIMLGQAFTDSAGCSYQTLLNDIGLGQGDNATLVAARPVRNWQNYTVIYVDLYLYAVVEVNEKFQSFSAQVYLQMNWVNEFLSWNPEDYCEIGHVTIPKEYVWKPDLSIYESIDSKAGMTETPFVQLWASGISVIGDSYKLTCSCKMDLYKFPFDTQRCMLTVLSIMYHTDEVHLLPLNDTANLTSVKIFRTGGEWELIGMQVDTENLTINGLTWDQVVYTVIIKRRPLLYVVNFLLPVLYFIVLDFASFFISEDGGEKLGFKVTLLLAISVLLLILHDLLPSTDHNIPLIGVYCSGIFTALAVSVLETIAVSFLKRMAKKIDVECRKTKISQKVENADSQQAKTWFY
ncbi:5-hydroxytryptamine receptor 3A [Denticeps clupeoides]|uniref:5-hydroxytryptamine receptor 3A n=1 Tax=Denticeps clupeoides TaxID=299321 RepID=UPI0010A2C81D|nr:5-hydroxytryptamine receptor 3A-like [Denticeps clupeoides]